MATRKCPACSKSMEGQVTMCPLCGEAYHKSCFKGSWDCVFCTTQIAGSNKTKKSTISSPLIIAGIFIILLISTIVAMYFYGTSGLLNKSKTDNNKTDRADIISRNVNSQLDTLRLAISHYEKNNGPLRGTSLEPLVGGSISSLPKDSSGNNYLFDGNIGVISSSFNSSPHEYCFLRKRLHVKTVVFDSKTKILNLKFNKPYFLKSKQLIEKNIKLLLDKETVIPSTLTLSKVVSGNLDLIISLTVKINNYDKTISQLIKEGNLFLDFTDSIDDAICEKIASSSPCDTKSFGEKANKLTRTVLKRVVKITI